MLVVDKLGMDVQPGIILCMEDEIPRYNQEARFFSGGVVMGERLFMQNEKLADCNRERNRKALSVIQITPKGSPADAKLFGSSGLVVSIVFHNLADDRLVHFIEAAAGVQYDAFGRVGMSAGSIVFGAVERNFLG